MSQETIIDSSKTWSLPSFAGLWENREIISVLVRRDFISKYKQTLLGPLWYIIQPLIGSLLFTYVFSIAVGIPTDGVPPILFYLCGTSVWNFFVACMDSTSLSLLNNSHLFQKIYFPRVIAPISAVIAKLYSFAIQFAVILLFVFYFHLTRKHSFILNFQFLCFPILILQTGALSLGVGLWIAALSTRYRDFFHITSFLIQLWMFSTPIIYPYSSLKNHMALVAYFNPMCAVIEGVRYTLLGTGGVSILAHVASALITMTIFISGLAAFQRIEKSFVDTL